MSDYQQVRVVSVAGAEISLEVRELHPDMEAIHLLLGKQRVLSKKREREAAIFAAFLLAAYRFGDNSFIKRLSTLEEEEGLPEPREVIKKVEFTSLEAIGVSSNGPPLYRAMVVITVADPKYIIGFKPTKKATYGAAAYGQSDWDDVVSV